MSSKVINVAVGLIFVNGVFDKAASDAAYEEICAKTIATRNEDFDSVAPDLMAYLIENPSKKNESLDKLVEAIHTRRMMAGFRDNSGPYAGKSPTEVSAARVRLAEVLEEYIKDNDDQFHIGKKLGVAFRYVTGENQKKDGEDLLVNGAPVQAYRWTDADWTRMVEASKEAADKRAEKKAAKEGAAA